MKVEKIALYYPNGQTMMELANLEGSVDDIIKIANAGLSDVVARLPDLTKHAKNMFESYEEAKKSRTNS